jgi:hypothetical protein
MLCQTSVATESVLRKETHRLRGLPFEHQVEHQVGLYIINKGVRNIAVCLINWVSCEST